MAIMQVTIIPMGKGTSVSRIIAAAVRVLKEKGVDFKLTPTGTVLEGELGELLGLAKEMHEAVMQACDRAVTFLVIDDRRDKPRRGEDKVKAVLEKL